MYEMKIVANILETTGDWEDVEVKKMINDLSEIPDDENKKAEFIYDILKEKCVFEGMRRVEVNVFEMTPEFKERMEVTNNKLKELFTKKEELMRELMKVEIDIEKIVMSVDIEPIQSFEVDGF